VKHLRLCTLTTKASTLLAESFVTFGPKLVYIKSKANTLAQEDKDRMAHIIAKIDARRPQPRPIRVRPVKKRVVKVLSKAVKAYRIKQSESLIKADMLRPQAKPTCNQCTALLFFGHSKRRCANRSVCSTRCHLHHKLKLDDRMAVFTSEYDPKQRAYLAPSTLPGTGTGVFAGMPLQSVMLSRHMLSILPCQRLLLLIC